MKSCKIFATIFFVLVLVRFVSAQNFKSGSEPEHFRDIKWGTDIESLPAEFKCPHSAGAITGCVRPKESMFTGKVSLDEVLYFFVDKKFSGGGVITKTGYCENLKQYAFETYGEGSRVGNNYLWIGMKGVVVFMCQSDNKGYLVISEPRLPFLMGIASQTSQSSSSGTNSGSSTDVKSEKPAVPQAAVSENPHQPKTSNNPSKENSSKTITLSENDDKKINLGEQSKKKNQLPPTPPKTAPTVSTKPQIKPSSKYLTIAFDPDIERIPVPFSGHDTKQIYKALENGKKVDQKNEFESTEQYRKRVETQTGKPLFGSVNRDAVFAFIAQPTTKYDADTQTLIISLPASSVWTKSTRIDESRLALNLGRTERSVEKSLGQNAFGAQVAVTSRYIESYRLAVHNQFDFETEKALAEETGKVRFIQEIKIQPEQARTVKNKVAILILAKLTSPYSSYGVILSNATLENPTEYFHQMYYVDVDLQQMWVYDKTTGEIIARTKGK